jgi:hypothetical protein
MAQLPENLPSELVPLEGGDGPESEAKRREARRRFLLRTTATSGVAIVTLCHQRKVSATNRLVSSEAACASIHGISYGTANGSVAGVTRIKCHLG